MYVCIFLYASIGTSHKTVYSKIMPLKNTFPFVYAHHRVPYKIHKTIYCKICLSAYGMWREVVKYRFVTVSLYDGCLFEYKFSTTTFFFVCYFSYIFRYRTNIYLKTSVTLSLTIICTTSPLFSFNEQCLI